MLGLGSSLSRATFAEEFVDLTSFSGLSFYYKNATNVTTAGWGDQSSNENDMTQTNTDFRASLANGGLFFDGGNDHYLLDNNVEIGESNPFTLFWAGNIKDHSTSHTLISNDTNNLLIKTVDVIELTIGSVSTTITYNEAGGTFPNRTEMQLCIRKNADRTIDVFKNGAELTKASETNGVSANASFTASAIGFTEGADIAFSGKMYELALYQEALSGGKIEIITNYLSDLL